MKIAKHYFIEFDPKNTEGSLKGNIKANFARI